MPKLKAEVTFEMYTEGFEKELEEYLNEQAGKIANSIKKDAKATAAFIDKSGRLRQSIKRKKSKFDDGGYMVKAGGSGAMQAWLVEHGHGPGQDGKMGWYHGDVPAHPFLKPALDKNIQTALATFNEGMK